MKTKILNLVMLLGFIALSNWAVAQTTIYVNAGETLRVACWNDDGVGNNTTPDTDCQVNLDGNEYGELADTIIATGPFYMELGNTDPEYLYYDWLYGSYDTHTVLVEMEGEWIGSKYHQGTGYGYVGFFWIRFEPVVNTYDVTFNVTDNGTGNPINGASVTFDGMTQATNGSGITIFTNYEDGSYIYAITASGYVTENGVVAISGSNVTENVTMTETAAPTYVVNFSVNAASKGIVGATVTLTGYGDQTTDGSGNCSFTDIPDGTYDYDVVATDYQDASGSVTVNGGNVQENVYMDPSGLHDISEVEINVYPNPTTDYVTIAGVSNVQWAVYSITGQEIMRGSGEKVDMYNLNTGYYMLKVITEEGSVVKRILKR